jgi:hypothetical protein
MNRLLFLFPFVLAACGGGGTTSTPAQVTGQCTGVSPPHLLYPQNGATGIAQANLQLYFGYPSNPGTAFAPPVLTPANAGSPTTGGPYALDSAGALPSGAATPSPGDQVDTSAISSLATGTTYTVTIAGTVCAGTYTLGTFST